MTAAPTATAPVDRRKDRRLLLVLGALAGLGPAAMDVYFPALPSVTDDFGVSVSVAQLTVSMFVVGLAVGQLLAGPISDTLGRRRPLLASIGVYLTATVACALAPTVGLLAAGRLLQGLAAAAGIAIGRAVVRDLYEGNEGARFLSRLVIVYGTSPLLAPIVGGQLVGLGSWRLVFAALIVLGTTVLLATLRELPETLPPERRTGSSLRDTVGSFGVLLRDRELAGFAVVLGCVSGAIIVLASMAPYVLEDIYGMPPQVFAIVFGVAGAGMVGASLVNARIVGRIDPATLLWSALAVQAAMGAMLVVTTLIGLGPWPLFATLLVMLPCWAFSTPNALALALAGHPSRAGAASALLGLAQYSAAAVLVPLVGLAGRGTGLPMAIAVLTLGLVALTALRLGGGPRPRSARPRRASRTAPTR